MTILTIIKPCCPAVRENFFRPQKTVGQLRDRLETNLVDFFCNFFITVIKMMVVTVVTIGGGFDFWDLDPINCFGWWWSIGDDNDYFGDHKNGDRIDVTVTVMIMMVEFVVVRLTYMMNMQ